MKKILVLLLVFLSSGMFITQVNAETNTDTIYVHYYRYAGDYSQWSLWAWQSEPTSEAGNAFDFVPDETSNDFNFGGVVAIINIDDTFPNITSMGLIVRLGDWIEKDIDSDRFVDIPSTSTNGEFHIYLVEGDPRIGISLNDPLGPDKSPKFKNAYFTELNTIYFSATEEINPANIKVFADSLELTIDSVNITGNSGEIVLQDDLDFSKTYKVQAVFSSDSSTNDYIVTFDGIYDSQEFNDEFGYDGSLGAIVNGDRTTFKLWAPVSTAVILNLYDTGTPAKYGGTDIPIRTISMTKGEKGVFSYTADENLHGIYYTYSVTNGDITNEVVDPYARSTGINGLRGLVVDFNQVNPDGFIYNTRPDNMTNYTDAIIYELHVRDLTSSDTWNGTEANRGKFLGLVESGTSYNGVTTGFDHIVELGITHVQLLPIFDFGVVDETRLDDADYNSFNWGYMPLNFNSLEGSYSKNPYDGLTRISEMKQVVMAFSEANIRVNMDVVYNHTGLSANSNFNLIVPGYYYRLTDTGSFSNGSGTGNETASERYMMRKFIVDSTVFWATEYNISGFRFDLMSLHDIETMNEVADALHSIDPTIMVYGEPWTGGTSTLPADQMASKNNLRFIDGVAAFNDDTRDGIKGSVFQREAGGYIQDGLDGTFDLTFTKKVKYGITGGIDYPYLTYSYSAWHTQPTKTINYVTAHDNNTLYDKLYLTLERDEKLDLIPVLVKQAYGIVLTSQGIPFIHAGDEFMRSKPIDGGDGFDHNSYESPDSVNQIRWDLKASELGQEVYQYIKGLIALRKNHPSFRMPTSQDVIDNLNFLYNDLEGVIAYSITNNSSDDSYSDILIIQNANDKSVKIKLPTGGGWVLITDNNTAGSDEITTYLGGSNIKVAEHSTFILYQDTSLEDYNPLPTIIISIVSGTVIIGAAVLVFVLKIKKK